MRRLKFFQENLFLHVPGYPYYPQQPKSDRISQLVGRIPYTTFVIHVRSTWSGTFLKKIVELRCYIWCTGTTRVFIDYLYLFVFFQLYCVCTSVLSTNPTPGRQCSFFLPVGNMSVQVARIRLIKTPRFIDW